MEYGKYELFKRSNSGDELIETFEGIGALDKGIEAFMEYCADHPEDDGWVARRYGGLADDDERMGNESVERLLMWMDRNGQIHEDFLNGHYTLYLLDVNDLDDGIDEEDYL